MHSCRAEVTLNAFVRKMCICLFRTLHLSIRNQTNSWSKTRWEFTRKS